MVSFEVGGGENVPVIPGTYATRNFTYLVRGPLLGGIRHEAIPWDNVNPDLYCNMASLDHNELSWGLTVTLLPSLFQLRHCGGIPWRSLEEANKVLIWQHTCMSKCLWSMHKYTHKYIHTYTLSLHLSLTNAGISRHVAGDILIFI